MPALVFYKEVEHVPKPITQIVNVEIVDAVATNIKVEITTLELLDMVLEVQDVLVRMPGIEVTNGMAVNSIAIEVRIEMLLVVSVLEIVDVETYMVRLPNDDYIGCEGEDVEVAIILQETDENDEKVHNRCIDAIVTKMLVISSIYPIGIVEGMLVPVNGTFPFTLVLV